MLTQLGAVPRLCSAGVMGARPMRCVGILPPSIGNRDITLPDGCDGWSSQASRCRFFVRPRYRFFVPTWL